MGAVVHSSEDWYDARTPQGLHGASIYLDYPSVTGTENLLLAACLAAGRTLIKHASCEPEVVALADFLTAMGAQIRGAGTAFIEIEGVPRLHGAHGRVIADRIEAGTFAAAAVATEGEVLLRDVNCDHVEPVLYKLQQIGAETACHGTDLLVRGRRPFRPVEVQAIHFPGFPTDLQAVFAALLTQAEGLSIIQERVYENRLLYEAELRKMGADIVVRGQRADISGPTQLQGAAVRALDLRAGACLIVGALVAAGTTTISDVHHIQRGYEDVVGRLASLGADIHLIEQPAAQAVALVAG
jgi:UDP-N-acetylglucosamine 1-carboxyvinyltransferase